MKRIKTKELADAFIEEQVALLRKQIGDKKVLLALSGGVDSSVVAALLIKAVGKQLVCVHVNHGLLRKGEPEQVIRVFKEEMDANLVYVDAVDRFLDKLAGVDDPETKRKIIGTEFIRVFEEEARKLEGIEFLAQGTIYPDIVESAGVKAHHNAGGLPDDLKFELVEPLRYLYKDEVRVVGKELGLPDGMVFRQPFPGPGLGVRCLGAITRDRLEAVRESDAILREEFAKAGLEGKVWQYFTAIPDFRSTGVKDGKERTYYIYNNCDHEEAFRQTGTQAVSFTTGVPAALGASMWAKGLWRGAGVFNVEEFDPDPFLAELGPQGLPWVEKFDVDLEV